MSRREGGQATRRHDPAARPRRPAGWMDTAAGLRLCPGRRDNGPGCRPLENRKPPPPGENPRPVS